MNSNPYLIEASNLNLSFTQEENLFVENINLTLQPKTGYLLLGPSAAGKTVLLKLLAGLETPTSGSVKWEGRPIAKGKELINQRNKLLSLIPASFSFINLLSAKENLLLPARLNNLTTELINQRLDALISCFDFSQEDKPLRKLSLSHLLQQKKIKGFSNGQKEMLALARALIQPSKILLADELLRSFNQEAEAVIWQRLVKWLAQEQQGFFIITHKEHLAKEAAIDKVLRIKAQQLITED